MILSMLNRIVAAQECDAREVDSSNAVKFIKKNKLKTVHNKRVVETFVLARDYINQLQAMGYHTVIQAHGAGTVNNRMVPHGHSKDYM